MKSVNHGRYVKATNNTKRYIKVNGIESFTKIQDEKFGEFMVIQAGEKELAVKDINGMFYNNQYYISPGILGV